MIVDVEKAGGHFGAFENATGLDEMPAFIARERGIANAVKPVRTALDGIAETGQILILAEAHDFVVETVDVFPHLARDAIANSTRVLAGLYDAALDGVGVIFREAEKFVGGLAVGLRGFCRSGCARR